MKRSCKACSAAILTSFLLFVATISAFADTYHLATFTGGIFGGTANVKAPFNSVISPGAPVSGNFVIDDNLIPAANSGYVNVFFASFPDNANIPAATAFSIDLGGGLTFTLADAIQNSGAVQFHNGIFNGFFFDADFMFSDSPYRLDMQGKLWNIKLLDQIGGSPVPLTSAKVSGYLNDMTLGDEYVPDSSGPGTVPEPSTILLLGAGLAGFGLIRLRTTK